VAKLAGILPENPVAATMIRALVILICVFIVSAPALVLAVDADRSSEMVARADALGLAKQPAWLALLHVKRESLWPRTLSQADAAGFFLAANGRTDPEAELRADLRAMLQVSAKGHAQCRFPARWYWLKQQLQISGADVPCPKFERWLEKMQSDTVSLVFPSMYLNNPGSSFGHTFLRFNHPHSELLSQTLNYAADVDQSDDGIRYIFKGLFGGYHGVFRSRPYYETVQTYSNLENRDIWEYPLALTGEEVAQLRRHVWEVVGINFDYLFFRENCSYRLLSLIDAVRPEARLSSFDAFPLYAVPVDTVRALARVGLVQHRVYRPSLASQIQYALAKQSSDIDHAVVALADAKMQIAAALAIAQDDESRAALLNTAYQILQFRDQHHTLLAKNILSERASIRGVNSGPIAEPVAPELGHESARISLSAGRLEANAYSEIALKPAFHELLDAPAGYVSGAEINVMDTRLRWSPDNSSLQLQELRFFNVVSLSPWQDWYRPLSWQLDIKLRRAFIESGISDLVLNTRIGGGISQRALGSIWYGMFIMDAEGSDHYAQGYSILPGVQLGMNADFGLGQLSLSAEHNRAIAGYDFSRDRLVAGWQFNITAQSALRLDYEKVFYDSLDVRDLRASVHVYF
jgi:hypothetical protein